MKIIFRENKFLEFILWLTSYIPLILIAFFNRMFMDKDYFEISCFLNKESQILIPKLYLFLLIILFSFLIYHLANKMLFYFIKNKILKSGSNKKIILNKYENLSLDEYTYFIISLFSPFLFENFNYVYSIFLFFIFIIIIIFILIKLEKIILNPIFLFSNLKILKASLIKVGGNKLNINCYIISDLSFEELENEKSFLYDEFFKNVYFLTKA